MKLPNALSHRFAGALMAGAALACTIMPAAMPCRARRAARPGEDTGARLLPA
ncbi:hypothetical protein ACTMU2_37000 [Cupriavidus basilensis]